jgi:hypothetical protein
VAIVAKSLKRILIRRDIVQGPKCAGSALIVIGGKMDDSDTQSVVNISATSEENRWERLFPPVFTVTLARTSLVLSGDMKDE